MIPTILKPDDTTYETTVRQSTDERPPRSRPSAVARSSGGRLRGDRRAASEIIGAILLFAVVLALLVLIQVTAVPSWNEQLEYEQNLRAQEDMRDLDRALEQAAARGAQTSTVVELGVRYPPRPFLFSPGPAAGTIETGPEGTMVVNNAEVADAEHAWSESEPFATRELVYRPSYNEYESAPETVHENGFLYNNYGEQILVDTEPDLIDGRRVNLLTTTGRISESSAAPTTVQATPRSDRTQTIGVRSADGSPIELRLPTRLDETQWRELLGPELDEGDQRSDAHVRHLEVEEGDPYDTLVLELDPGPVDNRITYDFRMANVGLGDEVERESAHYVTDATDPSSLRPGETEQVTVEVRNRYNNPVSGVSVTFEPVTGDGEFVLEDDRSTDPVDATTDSDGRATVQYRALSDSTITVSGDLDGNDTVDLPREQTTVSLEVVGNETDLDGDPDLTTGGINPYGPRSVVLVGTDVNRDGCARGTGGSRQCNVDLELLNRDDDSARLIEEIRVNFAFTGSASQQPPQSARTLTRLLQVRGPFVDVGGTAIPPRTIDAGREQTVSIQFYDDTGGTAPSNIGGVSHLIAVTVVYDDEQVSTYFVDTSD